jgi:hypothetical protein
MYIIYKSFMYDLKRSAYRILVGKPERKRPLGRLIWLRTGTSGELL